MIKKSPIDDLFNEIYGYHPPKAGQSYEMLVAAAFKLLLDEDISYNQTIRGDYSDTVYQLDGLVHDSDSDTMIEAKDYTIYQSKVGREDIQKLQGALLDLSIKKGRFASATQYTKPAVKYAQSSQVNLKAKPIDLYHIRPSTTEDENGRLKTIKINMSMHTMDFNRSQFNPIFTEEAISLLKDKGYENKLVSYIISEFCDRNGDTLITIEELTGEHAPSTTWEDGYIANGCWVISGGYISVEGTLYEIKGLKYCIPFQVHEQEIVIEAEGKAKLFVKSEDGSINKLISDADLKKVIFSNGRVNKI